MSLIGWWYIDYHERAYFIIPYSIISLLNVSLSCVSPPSCFIKNDPQKLNLLGWKLIKKKNFKRPQIISQIIVGHFLVLPLISAFSRLRNEGCGPHPLFFLHSNFKRIHFLFFLLTCSTPHPPSLCHFVARPLLAKISVPDFPFFTFGIFSRRQCFFLLSRECVRMSKMCPG